MPRVWFLAAWIACAALLAAAGAGALFALHAVLAPEERAAFTRLLAQGQDILYLFGVILIAAAGLLAAWLARTFIVPLSRLETSTRLIAAGNPSHRAAADGPLATRELAAALNSLADRHETLLAGVQDQIRQARADLDDEKDRLAALMSELASSVVVCTIEGRVLLYNEHARQTFSGSGIRGFLGLGRSIFSLLDRPLVAHALDQLRERLARGEARPVSVFLAAPDPSLLLRVRMAPFMGTAPAAGRTHEPGGFILLMDDVAEEIELTELRDRLLERLIERARAALASIRAASENLERYPDMRLEQQARFTAIIGSETQRLTAELEGATREHSGLVRRQWSPEQMRAVDFLALVQRRVESQLGLTLKGGEIDGALWVRVDSYSMAQALTSVLRRIRDEFGGHDVRFDAAPGERHARIDILWAGARPTAASMRAWETEALHAGAAASPVTLRDVLERHRAEAWLEDDARGAGGRFRLLLPLAEPGKSAPAAPAASRPEYYDFDLFGQPASTRELDERKLTELAYTAFDTETTGLEPAAGDEIISIGAVRMLNGRMLAAETFDQLVDPRRPLDAASAKIHGITPAMLSGQPTLAQVLPAFHQFCEDTVLVGHNAAFDMRFLQLKEHATGIRFAQPVLDTLLLSAVLHRDLGEHQLEAIAARFGVNVTGRHTALGDALVTGEVFLRMIPLLAEHGIVTLRQAREASQRTLHARVRY